MERNLRRDLRPHPGTYFDYYADSQNYRQWAARQEVSLNPTPLISLRPWVSYRHEERPAEFDFKETWFGLGASCRLSTALSLSGNAGVLPSRDPGTGYAPLTGEAYLGIQPADGTQMTLALSHNLFTVLNSAPAVPRRDRLVGSSYGFILSQKLDYRTAFTANYDYSTYDRTGDSSAHFRHNGRARVRTELHAGKPKLWVEAGYQHIDFNVYAPIGVWTPDRFQSAQLNLDTEWKPWPNWTVSGGLSGGTQREEQKNSAGALAGEWDEFGGFTALVSTQIGRVHAYVGGGHANSSFETGRGYRRSYGYTGLSWWF